MEQLKYVNLEEREGIARVTINRPEALNALNTDVLADLETVFRSIAANEEIKVVILTGTGKAFVAGADIALMSDQALYDSRKMTRQGQKLLEFIENLDIPVIAAINGYALGGGCELAMACDIRIASDRAKFGQPEVNLGIIPGFGGTQRLPRLVGKGMAKHLIFSGDTIDAQEAYRIGLVEMVFPHDDLAKAAEEYAQKLMKKAPIGLKMAKIAINEGINMDLKTGVAFEAEAYVTSFCSEDRVEGMKAFLEKRPAKFKNR